MKFLGIPVPLVHQPVPRPEPAKVFVTRAASKHQANLIRTKDETTAALRRCVARQREAGGGAYEAVAIALADHVDTINASRARAA